MVRNIEGAFQEFQEKKKLKDSKESSKRAHKIKNLRDALITYGEILETSEDPEEVKNAGDQIVKIKEELRALGVCD